jgi:hypothetical protein
MVYGLYYAFQNMMVYSEDQSIFNWTPNFIYLDDSRNDSRNHGLQIRVQCIDLGSGFHNEVPLQICVYGLESSGYGPWSRSWGFGKYLGFLKEAVPL